MPIRLEADDAMTRCITILNKCRSINDYCNVLAYRPKKIIRYSYYKLLLNLNFEIERFRLWLRKKIACGATFS